MCDRIVGCEYIHMNGCRDIVWLPSHRIGFECEKCWLKFEIDSVIGNWTFITCHRVEEQSSVLGMIAIWDFLLFTLKSMFSAQFRNDVNLSNEWVVEAQRKTNIRTHAHTHTDYAFWATFRSILSHWWCFRSLAVCIPNHNHNHNNNRRRRQRQRRQQHTHVDIRSQSIQRNVKWRINKQNGKYV